jgi:lysophosphatidate acyltransferase
MNKTTVVAKRELLYVFPFGVCAWLCGLVFIDRYSAGKAKTAMSKAMERLKKTNVKLWVFPEGKKETFFYFVDFNLICSICCPSIDTFCF